MVAPNNALQPRARAAAGSVGEHVRRTVALAWPVVLARSGALVMAAVDTAMTGRAGADELAFIGLGLAPTISLLVIGLGLLLGTTVLTAQADGAGAERECGMVWRVAMRHAVVIGLAFLVLCWFGEAFLLAIGQDPVLAEGAGRVIVAFGWGMPPVMLTLATTFFLEGISRPIPGMLIMLGANVVNFGLNWIVIYGHFGLPALGAEGAMLTTSATRWLVLAAFLIYVFTMRDGARYGLDLPVAGAAEIGRRLRRLGYPMALAHGLETTAFAALTMMAGYLGTTAVAGYQVAMNILTVLFMAALGIGTATGIRVGNAVGRQDPPGLRRAGWTGLGLVIVLMALLGLWLGSYPGWFAAIYSQDRAVLAVAATTLIVAALMLVFDGSQAALVQALRGAGDVWVPMQIQLLWTWGIAVPCGAYLAFRLGWGAPGLMGGVCVGAIVAAFCNALRFHIISKRPVVRA